MYGRYMGADVKEIYGKQCMDLPDLPLFYSLCHLYSISLFYSLCVIDCKAVESLLLRCPHLKSTFWGKVRIWLKCKVTKKVESPTTHSSLEFKADKVFLKIDIFIRARQTAVLTNSRLIVMWKILVRYTQTYTYIHIHIIYKIHTRWYLPAHHAVAIDVKELFKRIVKRSICKNY